MKLETRAKRAFHALTVIGAPVDNYRLNDSNDSIFTISGEPSADEYDGKVWADFYNDYSAMNLNCDFVDKDIATILAHYGLEYEWSNPGVLDVYNIGDL
jgi:hypothetical protein